MRIQLLLHCQLPSVYFLISFLLLSFARLIFIYIAVFMNKKIVVFKEPIIHEKIMTEEIKNK